MDLDLHAYDDTWRITPKSLRNDVCQALADAYVAAHPELRTRYGGRTVPELVALLEVARESGDEERRIEIDIWINAAFEYQQIGGSISTDGIHRPLPFVNADGDRRAIAGGQ